MAKSGSISANVFLAALKAALEAEDAVLPRKGTSALWTGFMVGRIEQTARFLELGICSNLLGSATDDWRIAERETGLRREYLYDFTLFRTWEKYEQPVALIEHENAWNKEDFLLDFWKLLFGFAPLRVMFGYASTGNAARKYIDAIHQASAKNQWRFPEGVEDLVLLGNQAMEATGFEVFHRTGSQWENRGLLANISDLRPGKYRRR